MNKSEMLNLLICCVSLASCSTQVAVESSHVSSSSICVDDSGTHPAAASFFSKHDGGYVYIWRNQCGAVRCYFDWETFGDPGFKLSLGVPAYSTYLSCTLEEMRSVLAETSYFKRGLYIGVFEIPYVLGDGITEQIANDPYPYICNDKSVYEKLGLDYCYDIAESYGYFDLFAADYLADKNSVNKEELNRFTPLCFKDYVVVTSTSENHIFRFDGETMISHERKGFVFFDATKKDESIGGSFENMIGALGCPDYVSEDGASVDYIDNQYVYRYWLNDNGGNVSVARVEQLSRYKAIHDNRPEKKLPASIAKETHDYMTIAKMIRKLGKPTARVKTSGNLMYAYTLDDGTALTFNTYSVGLTYERNGDTCAFSFALRDEALLESYGYATD